MARVRQDERENGRNKLKRISGSDGINFFQGDATGRVRRLHSHGENLLFY